MRYEPAFVNISKSLRPQDRMKLGALRADIDFGAAERVVIRGQVNNPTLRFVILRTTMNLPTSKCWLLVSLAPTQKRATNVVRYQDTIVWSTPYLTVK